MGGPGQGLRNAGANRPEHGSWDGAQLCRISFLQTPQCAASFSTPAAGNFLSPAEQLSANGFRTVMEIDTFGTFHMCVMHAEEAHTGAVWALCLPLGVWVSAKGAVPGAAPMQACLLATNVSENPSALRRCRAAFEELKKSGDGVIINISMTLHYGATWWQSHACAAKVGWGLLLLAIAG